MHVCNSACEDQSSHISYNWGYKDYESCFMNARNHTQIFWRKSLCSELLGHLSSPICIHYITLLAHQLSANVFLVYSPIEASPWGSITNSLFENWLTWTLCSKRYCWLFPVQHSLFFGFLYSTLLFVPNSFPMLKLSTLLLEHPWVFQCC